MSSSLSRKRYMKEHNARVYREREAAGICVKCGKRFPKLGSKWCQECSDRHTITERLRKFGISQAQFLQLHEEQGGACAICSKPFDKKIDTDHDHKTGKVRGLLCNNCNRGIGHFQDNPDFIKKAEMYLRVHTPVGEGYRQ